MISLRPAIIEAIFHNLNLVRRREPHPARQQQMLREILDFEALDPALARQARNLLAQRVQENGDLGWAEKSWA
jgi:hypothetical protein